MRDYKLLNLKEDLKDLRRDYYSELTIQELLAIEDVIELVEKKSDETDDILEKY